MLFQLGAVWLFTKPKFVQIQSPWISFFHFLYTPVIMKLIFTSYITLQCNTHSFLLGCFFFIDPAAICNRPREVTYVNIPISPVSKKQLHYMELELQEHGSTIRGEH